MKFLSVLVLEWEMTAHHGIKHNATAPVDGCADCGFDGVLKMSYKLWDVNVFDEFEDRWGEDVHSDICPEILTKVVVVVVGVFGVCRFEGFADPNSAANSLSIGHLLTAEGFDCPKAVLEVWRISTVAADEGDW